MKSSEKAKRIKAMESILNDAKRQVNDFNELLPRLEELLKYYGSKEWLNDLDADNEGLLPKELKRGVLSEDGIYDLISDIQELKEKLNCIK